MISLIENILTRSFVDKSFFRRRAYFVISIRNDHFDIFFNQTNFDQKSYFFRFFYSRRNTF